MGEMKKHLKNIDENKIKTAFAIKKSYDRGEISLEEGRSQMAEKVISLTPSEIAYIEQTLKEFEEDECEKEDIQTMLAIFEDVMTKEDYHLDKDHPISCYLRENEALEKILKEMEDLVQYPMIKNQWLEIYERLDQFKIHLSRKQNQLYSILEQKGFDRPTTTMWTLDNFVRDEINDAYQLLKEGKEEEFINIQETLIADIRDLMDKENTVLYPTSLDMITLEEFEDMKSGDGEIGFAWIDVEEPKTEKIKETPVSTNLTEELKDLMTKYGLMTESQGVMDVSTGKLTLEQINLIYRHLPVDISYVDENEIVKFYSDTDHRVFPRSKNVIGRDVKNCHPRNSVHLVEEIIDKFRSGEENSVEFWINKPNLFIYIYYVAVRDEEGNFRGVLEMMQDCTHIRSLTDSRTLLTWSHEEENLKNTEKEIETPLIDQEGKDSEEKVLEEIQITADTKLKDLLDRYPYLLDELPKLNENFKMLKSPLARVMIPKATIAIMSERGKMAPEELIQRIQELIHQH
ncbi:MAG: PAS domain-containing protein [Tissierellia bacterium]|nr:PAS domain-containing protein [Tissierellia bacterium]